MTKRTEPPPSWEPSAAVKIRFSEIFGRTDLRISLSKAKFDEELDFDVRLAVEPRKPSFFGEKQNFRSKIFAEKNFLASKNETSGIV